MITDTGTTDIETPMSPLQRKLPPFAMRSSSGFRQIQLPRMMKMLFEIENLHFLLLHVVIECNIYDMIVMLLKSQKFLENR